MPLPNADQAVVEIEKLRDYCLNPAHERGKHKARVFRSACGLTVDHVEELRKALLDAVGRQDAVPSFADEFGRRYVVEFVLTGPTGTARVRSSWIIRIEEDFPRFVSCYVM